MPQPRLSEWQWLRKEVRPFLRVQIASLLLILTASFASLLDPLVMKWLIDDVLPNKRWEALLVAALGFFVLYVGRTLIGSVGGLITFYATQRFAYTLRGRLVRRLQTLSPAFYSTQPTGDLLQRVENDVTMIVDMGGDVIPTILRMTIMTVMSLTAMLVLEWKLTFIVLPLLPFFLYLRHRFRTILRRVSEDVREASGQQTSLLNEILAGVIQIQLLGAERRTARRFSRLNLRTMRTNRVRRYNELVFSLASMSVISLGMTLVIGYGGIQVLRGELTTGGLVAFYSYIGMLFAPMSTAVELYARLNRVRASIHRIQDLEHMEDVIEDAPDAVPLGHLPQAIMCDRVSFAYDPHKAALQSFSVKVARGERLALVGASGSGKTTVLKLMARLYDVEGGAISIDGIDVRKLTLRSVRDAIAFVPQDPVLFQGTMRENLLHARPDATAADLDRVAWMTCLTDVIQRLPGGWEATLGPMGAGLSGGERQRVAIARALLQDRPVLILDEATSALDSPTERRILAHLTNWGVDKIVLFVSHRMSAACWASRILVLEQGALVEQGGHESLFHPGTRYFELWQRQPAEPDQAPPAPGSEPLPVF